MNFWPLTWTEEGTGINNFYQDHMKYNSIDVIYPLVNLQKTMENHHVINGYIHYFDWAIFQFANCNRLPGRVPGSIHFHWSQSSVWKNVRGVRSQKRARRHWGGWGMDLTFHCPEPWVVEKEGKVEPGAATCGLKSRENPRENGDFMVINGD